MPIFLLCINVLCIKKLMRVVHYSCLVGLAFEGEGIDLTDPPPPPHTHTLLSIFLRNIQTP